MVIQLTKPTENQWAKVLKVILYLIISSILAVVTAYIAKNPAWLATLPGWNILGVFIVQILTTEEGNALQHVPTSVQEEAIQAGDPLPMEPQVQLSNVSEQ